MLQRVPGTQDLLDLAPFNQLANLIRLHLERTGFTEIMTPLIEPTELFQRSLGTSTDVISKELYLVASTHATEEERAAICLRPEATASTMRAYLQNNVMEQPWSVFTIGPMFRHERPQKGRYRQFHQANLELINTKSIAQDARLIALLDQFFAETLRLEQYALLINFMGCPDDRAAYIEQLRPFIEARKERLCSTCHERTVTNILRVFDCKKEHCRAEYADAPQIARCLCEACAKEWQQLQTVLEQLSVSFTYQPALVRGLDYYEKTVFEFVSTGLGAQNAFCGGGRYNHLALEIGAKQDVPSVGAAMGMERLLLLAEQQLAAQRTQRPLYLIVPTTPEQQTLALHIAHAIRSDRYDVEPLLEGSSVKNMLRSANKRGAKLCIIIGPDEQAVGEVTVKNMMTGTEEKVELINIADHLKNIL